METKEQLLNAVKKWVKIDNELRLLQKEVNNRKKEKTQVSKDLMETMRTHQIDSFQLKDGEIMYNKKNVKKPISQKVLLEILSDYYKGDVLKATEINNFISENRGYTIKETITRKINTKEGTDASVST
jgi:protein subunit release factor B